MSRKRKAAEEPEQSLDVLKLKKLDPTTLRDSCLIGLIAQKGTGKTTMLKDLLYWKRHIPAGLCFTASGESNGEYDNIFPKMFIYDTCDLAQFEELYRYQTTKLNKYRRQFTKEEKQEFTRQGIKIDDLPKEQKYVKDPGIIVVLEDMLADKRLFNKKIVRELAMNGRHQQMFAVLTAQYLIDLPVPIRLNLDYIFIFKEDSDKVRHQIYEMYCKVHIKTYSLFTEMMNVATADHKVLVIDARESSPDPHKKFKWYKASRDLPPYRIGCERYWAFAKKNYKQPDVCNRVIVNKYAARMASTRDTITASELAEVVAREEIAQGGSTNRKRKLVDVAAIPVKKQAVVLEDDEPAVVDVAIDDEEEQVPVVAEVKRRRSSRSQVE